MDLDSVSVHKHAKKELGQYPAILTSHLVNNPYLKAIGSKTNVIKVWANKRKTDGFYFGDTRSPNYIEVSLYHQSKTKLDYTVKEMKEFDPDSYTIERKSWTSVIPLGIIFLEHFAESSFMSV